MQSIVRKVSVVMLLLIAVQAAFAQSDQIPHKVKYERTQMLPTGVAFNAVTSILVEAQSSGNDYWLHVIKDKLDMTDGEATVFMNQLLVSHQAMLDEVSAANASHACSGVAGYAILDQLYDIEESIFEQSYDNFKGTFDTKTGALLDRWMSDAKSTIVYKRLDFEKADQISGNDSIAELTKNCVEE